MNKGKGNQEAMALIEYIPAAIPTRQGQCMPIAAMAMHTSNPGPGNQCPYSIGQGNQDKGKRINAYA